MRLGCSRVRLASHGRDRACSRRLAIVALLVPLASCSPFNRSVPEADLLQGGQYRIVTGIDVPKVDGVSGCGAQALASVIAHLDLLQDAADVASELPWHDVGATPVDLLLEARRRGFHATIASGSLEELAGCIAEGQTPLVMLDSGLEVRTLFTRYPTPKVMHWSVVSGIARDSSRVLLAAESGRHNIASRNDFLRRWAKSDHCMLILRVNIPGALQPAETAAENAGTTR